MKILTLVCLALFSLPSIGEPLVPDTPAGQAFAEWLTSFNSGDAAQVATFNEKYDRDITVEEALEFRETTGGFEVLRVDESQPHSLLVLLKERDSDRAARLSLNLKGDDLIMTIRGALLPAEFAPERLSQTDALAALMDRADSFTEQARFSGALLVARGGDVLLQRSWGYANRELKEPVTVDTQFRLGSMNKMFTAVAVLQLVDSGKVSLNGTLGEYLPDYPNKELASKVTVRHLLSHTGGTGDFFGREFSANREQLKEHSDYLKLFGGRGLQFEPGAEYRYSNYGYILLGALIEEVSEASYYDYVRRNVFAPAGMVSTDSLPESEEVPTRAIGYMKRNGAWVRNDNTLPYRGTAAGGGYSTVGDLLRFAEALQAGKLVPMTMVAEATKPQGNGQTYGYGFGVRGEDVLRSYGHNGGAPGMNGALSIFPQLGYVLIGLSNLDPPAADTMVEYYAARMPIVR